MDTKGVREPLQVDDADLSQSRFSNAKLPDSSFVNVALQRSSFRDVSLCDATFVDVNLSNVSITDANLSGMRINGIVVSDLLQAYESRPRAVLYAKDPERLAAFYSAVAGFQITDRQESFFVLGSPSAQLVIVQIPKRIADGIAIETPPVRRERASIKLVFSIENLALSRAKAAELGGELNPSDREWEFQGAKVCDGHDPEGNVFQLRHQN